jgi:hypothetical protein
MPFLYSFALVASATYCTAAFESEIISDITMPALDEGRALKIKHNEFWQPMRDAAEVAALKEHEALFSDARAVLAELPPDNHYVHQALSEALQHLRQADSAVLARAEQQSVVASEELLGSSPWTLSGGFSLITGGQNFIEAAIQRFVHGRYSSRAKEAKRNRRASILPLLRGAANSAGDVLKHCRAASKRSFDALKYDVYQAGAPKTPKTAETIADRIVAAAAETRRSFLGLVTGSAQGITRDAEGEHDNPSATVTQMLLRDMQPSPLQVAVTGGIGKEAAPLINL